MTMAGLEQPDSGSVVIDDTDLAALDEDALARFRGRRIGIVFQSFHLVPDHDGDRERRAAPRTGGRARGFRARRTGMRLVGLGERLHHYPAQLSGGEQQRVAIARAIVPNPAILVADEPTGNLDETTGESIVDLLFALKRDRGATLILVTHDFNLGAPLRPDGAPPLRPDRGRRSRFGLAGDLRTNSMHGTIPRLRGRAPADRFPSCSASPCANCAAGAGFGIFLACIALGVVAIAGIGSVSRSLTEGSPGRAARSSAATSRSR